MTARTYHCSKKGRDFRYSFITQILDLTDGPTAEELEHHRRQEQKTSCLRKVAIGSGSPTSRQEGKFWVDETVATRRKIVVMSVWLLCGGGGRKCERLMMRSSRREELDLR